MPPQNILISLRFAPLHQDILHRGLDKRQYSIYTEKGKRANEQPLLPQSHFSAVDFFYRVFFAEPLQPHRATGNAIIFALEGKAVIGYEGKDYPIEAGENFRFEKNGLHSVTGGIRHSNHCFHCSSEMSACKP